MSNPIICNRSPAPRKVAPPLSPVRVSLRSRTTQVQFPATNLYLGYSRAFYEPKSLVPEALGSPHFNLGVLFGNADGEVQRELASDWLRIEKSGDPSHNLRGTYFFGRLDAPMRPDGPLMLEFRVLLNSADISPAPSGVQFTGVVFGVFINNTGFMLRFFHDNLGNRWIEVFDANQNSIERVLPLTSTYRADYDWDGEDSTYKVLWDTFNDRMWVILSTGQDSLISDEVLITGKVSDFPAVPWDQIRVQQPVAFFGHAYPSTNSISRWKGAYLYNETTIGVLNGLYQGPHTGFIRNNHVTKVDVTKKLRDNNQSWAPLPESYSLIAGTERVVGDELVLERTSMLGSYGYYRIEPRTANMITMIDFMVRGRVTQRGSSLDQASGFEVLVSTGSRAVRVGFSESDSDKRIGILGTGSPKSLASYRGFSSDWAQAVPVRLVVDPVQSARLYRFGLNTDGLVQSLSTSVPITELPMALFDTAVGVLYNAFSSETLAEMTVSALRYVVGGILYEAFTGLPGLPWVLSGTELLFGDGGFGEGGYGGFISGEGSVFVENETLFVIDDDDEDLTRFQITETEFDLSDGLVMETLCRVEAYEIGGNLNPPRYNTGVGFLVDDGVFRISVLFADGGPELGKIVYLATSENYTNALFFIRAGRPETNGTFASVDWSVYHLYRLERDSSGGVRLYIDNNDTAVIDLAPGEFAYPLSEDGIAKVAFGSLVTGVKSLSAWKSVFRGISGGYDISVSQRLTDKEKDERFGKAANVIVTVST